MWNRRTGQAIRVITKDSRDASGILDIREIEIKKRKDGSYTSQTQYIIECSIRSLKDGEFVFLEFVDYDAQNKLEDEAEFI